MEFLSEYGLFLAKAVTIVIAILAVVGGILALSMRQRHGPKEHLEVVSLNDKYDAMLHTLEAATLPKAALKERKKAEKKEKKAAKKKSKTDADAERKRLYVLNFHGDIRASAVNHMREEISAILTLATPADEVLVRLESGGGLVHSYGLAASQLQRIRDHGIPLTATVDKVAASGGYMMACVADKILAAPFAILGSIGVLAQIPNFHNLLKKNDIDFEQLSAGEYKRTLTLFGENTDKARAKMQQELEETHQLFKEYVGSQRPGLDIDQVATGEHWLGSRARELGLVDELRTSDDYLMQARENADILEVKYIGKQNLIEKFLSAQSRSNESLARDLAQPWL
ncbi:MAG: protease SohB [Pseudomonadota bacterium]|nr:protease SohB [Pseudomonadota bacterium]